MMPENTKTENRKPKTENRLAWISFAFVIIFIYFFGLTIPLLGPDEPRYAQVAREMFERGDWVTPTLGGFVWFEKPALLYWLQIAAYKIFGVSELAARFGSALFGLGTIFCLWLLGKTVQSSRVESENFLVTDNSKPETQSQSPDFPNWLALIAASSIGLLVFSRGASFDIILTFPITASLIGFFIFDLAQSRAGAESSAETSKKNSLTIRFLPLIAFYFFIGVALIAKGLVGIVFPFAIVAFYHVLSWKSPGKTFIFSLFWGTILSLIVASAWYLPMYQTNGWKFIDEFFVQHHFQRYASNKYQHPQPFWFFFVVLPLMTIPWLPFFLAAIYDFVKGFFLHQDVKTARTNGKESLHRFFLLAFSSSSLLRFSIAWLLVPLVFFSLSGSKLPGYILPALPAALILTAEYVDRFARKSAKRALLIKSMALATFIVIAVILQFFVMRFAGGETVKTLIEAANERGYTRERIVNLYAVSHNLEFYGAGRLVRDGEGRQKRYEDVSVLVKDLKREPNNRILVLVPQKDVPNLFADESVTAETLGENGESALVLLQLK
ncbi:MAG TPA: glycosyltransferase family 39 protein [Pyrinomonadaceae bacterium]|jgi:4-amino-4-deoxy-L-arabinose transferase-like glycosyltransferase